jgi:hypothetical protein
MKVQCFLQLRCVLLRLPRFAHVLYCLFRPQALPNGARLAIQCDNLTCHIVNVTGIDV